MYAHIIPQAEETIYNNKGATLLTDSEMIFYSKITFLWRDLFK